MVSVTASAVAPIIPATGRPGAGLDARLAQLEIQLADWVNCPSCKTPEGKATIAELTSKISAIKHQIAASVSNGHPARLRTEVEAEIRPRSPAPPANTGNADISGTIGRRLDVFA